MSTLRAEVEGVMPWKTGLRRMLADLDRSTRAATADGAMLVERELKLILTLTSHPPGTKTPSPPGSPPSKISGHLAGSSTGGRPYGDGPYGWAAKAGPTAVYSRIQELGGWAGRGHRTFLPPRPYAKPVHERVKGQIPDVYRRRWADVIGRA